VKFFGIEDIATFEAFNILGVFMSGDDSNPRVFAGGNHRFVWEWIWKLLPQIVASFSIISNGILMNLCLRGNGREIAGGCHPSPTHTSGGKFCVDRGLRKTWSAKVVSTKDLARRVVSGKDLGAGVSGQ
jgi:hypothetical protein